MNGWEVYRQGSADERDYTIDGVPTTDGVAIEEAYLTLKKSLSDPDSAAVVFLTITTSADDTGVVSDSGLGDGSGTLSFVVSEAALSSCDPRVTYFRSIKVKLNNGRYSSPKQGADAPVRIIAAGIAKAGDTPSAPSTGVVGSGGTIGGGGTIVEGGVGFNLGG